MTWGATFARSTAADSDEHRHRLADHGRSNMLFQNTAVTLRHDRAPLLLHAALRWIVRDDDPTRIS